MTMFAINAGDAAYIAAYTATPQSPELARYQTKICKDCDRDAELSPYPHLVDADENVLIGCEGYHQINPNLLTGDLTNRDLWSDWTEPDPFDSLSSTPSTP